MEELVSVCMPTYKREFELIKKSIISVLDQSYSNLEFIIIDDSGEEYKKRDNIEESIKKIQDSRIKYIQHKNNLGANYARNTGIEAAQGKYIAFIDDDDTWRKDKLEKQIDIFNNAEEDTIGLVYCKANIIDENDNFKRLLNNELHNGNVYKKLLEKNFIGGNSLVVIPKNVLENVGGYEKNLASNQDWDLFLQIAKNYNISYSDEILVNYREHSNERITSNSERKISGWERMFIKYKDELTANPDIENIWKQKLMINTLKNKQWVYSLRLASSSFRYSPSKFVGFIKLTIRKIKNK
ncbi:glycosyltransferase family 2 protein [Aerococcus kribbianus]|uniref:Glycosyltransferase n=1 Tax=Aerococcus kribbianus TaxID=2999064 RepID=A0A9X3FVV0_9LACT|nr:MULTISPECIES: glycosyltransferase [unclassified Aerococcus]MCZ0717179.1 glycosyltransferase [Aerococcus sp. YH-aer221]MCZ0725467.1 glycosyltransferase [Aerococcus sp. YH-aer222]